MKISPRTEALYEIFKTHPEVSTDTRSIRAGSIFFALSGANFDGNRFAREALDKGASLAVVDNLSAAGEDDRFFVVDDVLRTLQELANVRRRNIKTYIIAITGSNGKTTTKELIARVIGTTYNVAMTKGNLNNHIGVPLTLLSMDGSEEVGIVEMGAGACGEIAELCEIAEPIAGLITNIGRAHLEGFGGEEGVKRGKGELYDYLNDHFGMAFYAREDETLSGMIEQRKHLVAKGYSTCESVYSDDMCLRISYRGEVMRTHLVGNYNRHNISAAIAIGEYACVSPDKIRAAIESYVPDNNRSQRLDTERNTVIMDCYNANPSSMYAAIENLLREPTATPKAVILGDMFELGDHAATEHRYIVEKLAERNISRVILVGEQFSQAGKNAPETMRIFGTRDELAEYLSTHPIKGHMVLVKGSRGMGLEKISELL